MPREVAAASRRRLDSDISPETNPTTPPGGRGDNCIGDRGGSGEASRLEATLGERFEVDNPDREGGGSDNREVDQTEGRRSP